MPPEDMTIITALRAFNTNEEKDYRSFRPKSQRDEVEKSIQNRFLDSAFGSARNDSGLWHAQTCLGVVLILDK